MTMSLKEILSYFATISITEMYWTFNFWTKRESLQPPQLEQ
uniref:Uncharacterized protein n=1 Tax=Anguilla anguilla TaxID=7936 RepID=A0A0E9RXX3_ANGAN